MADPKSRVSVDAVGRAVDALLQWMRARTKQRKAQLIEHDDILHLVLTLKKIPPAGRTNPYRIPLPHPLHSFSDPSAAASICLIVDDTAKSPLSPSAAQARIAADSLPIADVIALSGLRSDYRPYEARRRLCDSHDLFFADRRILPLLPRLLGKHFFKKKKTPHAVDLSRVGWPEQIRQCCDSTLLYLRTGTCSGIKVGRVSQDREEIVANAMAAIKGAVELVPKKWANVRSIHIKSVESLALPIYQVVPDMGLKIEGFEKEGTFDGELVQLEEEKSKGVSKIEVLKKKKKKRIHEVQLMYTVNDGNESDEKSVKRKAKMAKKDHSDGGGEGERDENNELSDKKMIKGIKKAKKDKEDVDGGQGDEKSAGKRTKKKVKKDENVDGGGGEGDEKSAGNRTKKKKAKKDEDVDGGEGDEKSAGKSAKKAAKKDGADDGGEGDAGNAFGSEMIKAKTVKTKRSKAGNEEGKGVKRIKGTKVRHGAV